MRKGGQLSSEGPLALTVRYNCHSPGSAVVTLRMEMEDGTHDAVVWSWRKENGVLDAEVGWRDSLSVHEEHRRPVTLATRCTSRGSTRLPPCG